MVLVGHSGRASNCWNSFGGPSRLAITSCKMAASSFWSWKKLLHYVAKPA